MVGLAAPIFALRSEIRRKRWIPVANVLQSSAGCSFENLQLAEILGAGSWYIESFADEQSKLEIHSQPFVHDQLRLESRTLRSGGG